MKIKSVRGNANTSDFSWLLSQPYYALSLGGGVISLPMEVYSVNRVWESGGKGCSIKISDPCFYFGGHGSSQSGQPIE